MTEQNYTQDSELEADTDQSESETVAQDTLDDTQVEGEQEKELARQKTRQGQIKKAQELQERGEQIPEDLKWALREIKPKEINEDLILKRLEDKQLFKSKKSEWESLPKAERALVKEKWELYKAKGFSAGEALAEAIEVSQATRSAENRGVKKSGASLPQPGKPTETPKEYNPLTASEEEIIAHMQNSGVLKGK